MMDGWGSFWGRMGGGERSNKSRPGGSDYGFVIDIVVRALNFFVHVRRRDGFLMEDVDAFVS